MCCLFGLLDCRHRLSIEQRKTILRELAVASEERGTDATGMAYFTHHRLYIQKAPRAAHRMRFRLAPDARYIMCHTRMTTQGNETKNYNNHPFPGKAGKTQFALAHNGMLSNDRILRSDLHLPATMIETDSYAAVQLIEREGMVDFDSLRYMAETLRGSFTITVLDEQNNLYFVRGNNPMCIYHFDGLGFYIYASTKAILDKAVEKLHLTPLRHNEVKIGSGEILRLSADGKKERQFFNDGALWTVPMFPVYSVWGEPSPEKQDEALDLYAQISGYDRDTIAYLRAAGFTWMDIEAMIYDPALMDECLAEVMYG